MPEVICVECELVTAAPTAARGGAALCGECAARYYVACAGCAALFPRDEARTRDGLLLCADCFARPAGATAAAALGEDEVVALVAEYLELHAEERRIGARLEEVKERLKAVASSKERAAGAVVLRAGEGVVRCSYRSQMKLRQELVPELESALGEEAFGALVERKVSFSPVKAAVEELLNSEDGGRAALRDLLRGVVEVTETATITVVQPKGK